MYYYIYILKVKIKKGYLQPFINAQSMWTEILAATFCSGLATCKIKWDSILVYDFERIIIKIIWFFPRGRVLLEYKYDPPRKHGFLGKENVGVRLGIKPSIS
jgi:hypothetical protein